MSNVCYGLASLDSNCKISRKLNLIGVRGLMSMLNQHKYQDSSFKRVWTFNKYWVYIFPNKGRALRFVVSNNKSYFKNNNFKVYAEKKKIINKELCTQFRAKSKSNSQNYIVNFFSSGRVVINVKDFRKKLLEILTPKLEELYCVTFDIKGATQFIQTTFESEPDHPNNNQQDNIWNGQDTNNIRNGKDIQNRNHQQNNTGTLEKKNQTSDNKEHNEQQAKNQLLTNDTCNSNDGNKTATENT